MQGLIVVPLFVGYDEEAGRRPDFSYDMAGGPYEEQKYFSIGSGSIFARGALKKLYADDMPSLKPCWPVCRRCTTRPTTTRPPADPT